MFNKIHGRLFWLAASVAFINACDGGKANGPATAPFYVPVQTTQAQAGQNQLAVYTSQASQEWQMVMREEFDGSSLNPAMWEAMVGDGTDYGFASNQDLGWGNLEDQWYLAANATVANGMLTITAKDEVAPNIPTHADGSARKPYPYTSARLRTINKFDFKYGRVEARAKAAPGAGLWSAIWMLSTDSPYGGWPTGGEVDIMEVINPGEDNENVFQTVHYGAPWPLNRQAGKSGLDVSDPGSEFHVYAIEWDEDEIRWYIDGAQTHAVGKETYFNYYYRKDMENWGDYPEQVGSEYVAGGDSAPFDNPFHLLVNLAVGGRLPGAVDTTDLPSEFVIDYIRVYHTCPDEKGTSCGSNKDRNLERPAEHTLTVNEFPLYTDSPMLPEGSMMMSDGSVDLPNGDTLAAGAILAEVVANRQMAVNVGWPGSETATPLTFQEIEVMRDSEATEVIEVTSTTSGNIVIYMVDGERIPLFGFGNSTEWWRLHAGELKFDMYIDSSGTDTDMASKISIKMDSVWPNLGFVELQVSELPMDQWFPVSVKVNDLLENNNTNGGSPTPLDTSAVLNLFVLEPTTRAKVMLDNITLACGHPDDSGCGIVGAADGVAEVPVYNDGVVGDAWGLGICAWDQSSNNDYCGDGATSNLITWTETNSGDPNRGTVLNVNFGTTGDNGVFFFRTENSALLNISNFEASGKLQFDLKIPAATVAAGMVYKVDGSGNSTGDQVIDLSNYTAGTWQTFEFDVSAIKTAGADITAARAVVIFPTWGDQQGRSFEVANVNFVGGTVGGGGGGSAAPGPELLVYNNGVVGSDWDLGTCAWDQNSGGNYCMGNTSNQITWSETTDPDRGKVLNVNFSTGSGVFFFDATHPPGVDLSNYTSGKLLFDLKIPATTVALGMRYKVDCKFPCTSGDQTLDLSSYTANTWQTFEADVSALVTAGLDKTQVNTGIVLFIPTSSSTGGSFQISHVRYDDGTRKPTLPLATMPAKVFDGGMVSSMWGGGITAFDEAISYASCTDPDDCPSIDWELVADEDTSRGNVLQVTHGEKFAGLFFATAANMTNNMSGYRNGAITFDIKVTNVAMSTHMIAKADCGTGCRGDDRNIGMVGRSGWQTVVIPISELMKHAESGGGALDLTTISTGVVIFPPFGQTDKVVWRLDNVHWLPTVPSSP